MRNLSAAIFASLCVGGAIYLLVNHYDQGWGWLLFMAFLGLCTFD